MSRLKSGKFGRIDLASGQKVYGLIDGFFQGEYGKGGGIAMTNYDFGFGYSLRFTDVTPDSFNWPGTNNPKNPGVQISIEEFAAHLREKRISINKKLNSKDLVAACWATRENYISRIIKNLESDLTYISHHTLTKGTSAKTGVYVICPATDHLKTDRCNSDPSKVPLEGVIINPRAHNPRDAAQALQSLNLFSPKIFPYAEPLGKRFFAYEVPQNAIEFVKNPSRLEFSAGV